MDDLKLLASSRSQLNHLLKITETYSQDIKMKLGTEKCKTNSILKGKHIMQENYTLQDANIIENMEPEDTYKYLGYQQKIGIEQKNTKEQLRAKYKYRLQRILRTELSGRNKVKAINTYAVPVLTYSFGIIKWNDTELEDLNRLTRTTCNKHRIHHIHAAVERFTLKRKEGGRGFIDLKNMNYKQIESLRNYFITKAETSQLHKTITTLATTGTPLKLNDKRFIPTDKITTTNTLKTKWKDKVLHGKHAHQLTQPYVDTEASNAWLTHGNIFGETEGFMTAIQDQIINTRNYLKYIIKEPTITTDKCRLCNEKIETIDHITSGCRVLAGKEYTNRHNNLCKIIHQQLTLKHFPTTAYTPYYKYKPETILENPHVKLYWDREVTTDRTIPHNRPDIILIDKLNKTTHLIEISVPNSTNLQTKHIEKIEKYLALKDEIKQLWHQDTVNIVPIIISATGIIPKTLHDSIKTIELQPNIYIPLQKSVILDTCAITRKALNIQ